MKGINEIIPLAQGTMTGLAIRYIMNVAFTEEEGDRPKVEAPAPLLQMWQLDQRVGTETRNQASEPEISHPDQGEKP